VVIIGGGIAGLGAARELARHGFPVTVLEAKTRLGGRICTFRQGKCPIELGAEFVHGRNKPFLRLVKEAGLATARISDSQQLFENGRLKRVRMLDAAEEVLEGINPKGADHSIQSFLTGQDLDARTCQITRGYVEGFNAAHIERVSAHAILKAQEASESMDGDWQGRIEKGYSEVIRFLESEILAYGVEVIRGAKAKRVHWRTGRVKVSWVQNGKTRTAEFDAALVTVSLGVLKAGTISFEPVLRAKRQAIKRLEFGNVVKVSLVFRKRWWPKSSSGFVQSLDEPLPTWWNDPRGPVLTGWAGGTKADRLQSLSQAQLQGLCLEILGRMFSQRPQTLRRQLVNMHHHRWDQDEDFLGAYSYIPVGGLDLPGMLAAPIANTLFFAGEATVRDAQMGMVFGAYETGLRAAREICRTR
jgi:monoamine oxidase